MVSEDCCSTSATLVKPRVWMSSAVMVTTGVWVSISVCGISEPVTVTLSRLVVPVSWAKAVTALVSSMPVSTAAVSGWRDRVELWRDMGIPECGVDVGRAVHGSDYICV